jgi:hypothetical protein
MECEVKGALKKYRRMRWWRGASMAIMALGAISAPSFFDLGQTGRLICWLGAANVWIYWLLERRLKTMQIRLAGMSDQLNALSPSWPRDPDLEPGPDDDLIGELNDW